MIQTRPDISFSVQWLSRYLQNPTKIHLNAAKNLLKYINSTKGILICFGAESNIILVGFADSDFAGNKDTSLSTWGYLFKIAGGPVCWKSKRASTVALSTLEAEFIALYEATREIEWLIGLYQEIEEFMNFPILILGDNQGANDSTFNPIYYSRTKHTLLKFHYLREKVAEGIIDITYLETSKMPADGLTKALVPQKHLRFLDMIGLKPAEL